MFDASRFVSGLAVKGCMIVVAEEMGKIDNEQAELLCRALTHMSGFEVAEACGLSPVAEDDPGLTSLVISFIATEHQAVMDYRNGNPGAINRIIGKVMKRMPEAAPAAVRKMIDDRVMDAILEPS
jgi:Asp-tRNA(Asn)/Glu-tRNA(Gln) amidotransferase B subunit